MNEHGFVVFITDESIRNHVISRVWISYELSSNLLFIIPFVTMVESYPS